MIINSGGDGNGGAGASKVTRDLADTMAQLPEVIEALTGISLKDLLKNLPAVKSAVGAGNDQPKTETPDNKDLPASG